MNTVEKRLLQEVADLSGIPKGAYNIRKDGKGAARQITENIEIRTKKDKQGIDVIIKPGTKGETVYIPVIITATGLEDIVYNTFDIGEDADVLIVAGCGIHNPGEKKSQHDGVHDFIIRRGARVRYVEKHYGEGEGQGKRVLNPKTIVDIHENASAEFELIQIKGVDSTKRYTEASVHENGHLLITERLLTHDEQYAESDMVVELIGENSTAQIISRSVAQGKSEQVFYPKVVGKNNCRGHVQCDAIIMDNAVVRAIPEIAAHHTDAQLVHEAAIGKIAGEQIIKLMSMGLTDKEAEETILQGFLK